MIWIERNGVSRPLEHIIEEELDIQFAAREEFRRQPTSAARLRIQESANVIQGLFHLRDHHNATVKNQFRK